MIDWSKPIQTRRGRKARVLCSDAHHVSHGVVQNIVALISDPDFVGFFSPDGTFDPGSGHPSDIDLVNVPPAKVKVEVRLIRRPSGHIYSVSIYHGETHLSGSGVTWDSVYEPGDETISSTTVEMEYEERT